MENTIDTNSGLEIRVTDNSPKKEDLFAEEHQEPRPLTGEEMDAILANVAKLKR